MSNAAQLYSIATNMNRYGSLIIFLFGSVGTVLNVIIFSIDRELKQNPCSRLFLSSSIAACVALFSGLPTRFFSSFGLDLTARYDILCKFYMIILLGSLSCSASFIALVSIERWLNSCVEANYRIISSMKNVNRAIITTITVLVLCYSQMLYCHAANQKGSRGACAGINIVCLYLNDFIHLILFVIIPVGIMIIFGLLTLRNIKHSHHRIANIKTNQIDNNVRGGSQRQQSTLTALMLIQVCLITICNLPAGIHKIYTTITENTYKSPEQRGIETIIFQLVYLLTYVGIALPFYLYTLTGKLFREALFRRFHLIFHRRRANQSISIATKSRPNHVQTNELQHE
ncbi:unnamed protein product [Rotaria sordida]|uniref:G-protein coupled receptors family 1 profile domain-containing protein n=1 Tax=Rotaria sordida TaxID=392033 RepID=A0A813YBS6_9BILA|nr:unnamed protein product [Rotaria sordida]CAF3758801.1 unnamed protein product [Rotaria sordida]